MSISCSTYKIHEKSPFRPWAPLRQKTKHDYRRESEEWAAIRRVIISAGLTFLLRVLFLSNAARKRKESRCCHLQSTESARRGKDYRSLRWEEVDNWKRSRKNSIRKNCYFQHKICWLWDTKPWWPAPLLGLPTTGLTESVFKELPKLKRNWRRVWPGKGLRHWPEEFLRLFLYRFCFS